MNETNELLAQLTADLNLTEAQRQAVAASLKAWEQTRLKVLAEDVARAKQGTQLTRRGFDLLGKAIAGKELRFTRVALGDANGITPDDDAQYEMSELIHQCFTADITQVEFTGGGTVAVRAQVSNVELEDSFRIVEIGLYALDPDTNEEILYCYRNTGTASDFMPGGGGAVLWNLTYTLITVISSATNITAVIDGGLVYITQTEFLQHINSDNPHPNIPVKAEPVTNTTTIWVNGGDDKLHPMTVSDLGSQMLGGDASNIPKMNSRLTQAEVNLTNLYAQLSAQKDAGISGNLMMIEPFIDRACVDDYSCPVTTAIAGISNIQVETDRDLKVGSWYTITDGSRSEYVRVKSIAKNGAAVVVILDNVLTLTYDLNNTQLLRTTALVGNQQATGAGDVRALTVNVNETFSGTGGNVEQTLILDTSQKNAGNFTVEGDGTFSADGYFTLTA